MLKAIGEQLFVFSGRGVPRPAYERCAAKDLGLQESWLRDAIFDIPELVIGPCRAAGLTEEEWYPWAREYAVSVGSIDVLLLSSEGRVAIVETKLASNPELRRRVLAQALDYLTQLHDALSESMPEIPKSENGQPVANGEEILESVSQGDALVIVASDEVDPRVARLSQALLSNHLVKQWDLALIDVALYRSSADRSQKHIVVPHIRSLVKSEPRQVVRVIVEGETPSAKVKVERITGDDANPARQKWDEQKFFENLEKGKAPSAVRKLAFDLRQLPEIFPGSIELWWGTGREGSMVVKRNGAGLIEVYGSGHIRFRPTKFPRALGEQAAGEYQHGLEKMIPHAMKTAYPSLQPDEAEKAAPALYELLRQILERVE